MARRGEFSSRGNTQLLCSLFDQRQSRSRCDHTHPHLTCEAHRRGTTRDLEGHRARNQREQGFGQGGDHAGLARHVRQEAPRKGAIGKSGLGGSRFNGDLVPISVQFVRHHLCECSAGACAHIDMRGVNRDAAVFADLDPGAKTAIFRAGGEGGGPLPSAAVRPFDPEDSTARHKGRANQEGPAFHAHHASPCTAAAACPVAVRIASRMRGYVPQRQMLVIASSTCASLGWPVRSISATAAMICPDWQ
jgi:hypothetical protein